jgi:signal transduction histidine kinase
MSFTALRRLSIFVYTLLMIAITCGNLMILNKMRDKSQLIHQRGRETAQLITKLHELQKKLHNNWHKKDQQDQKLILPAENTFKKISSSITHLQELIPQEKDIQLELKLTQQNLNRLEFLSKTWNQEYSRNKWSEELHEIESFMELTHKQIALQLGQISSLHSTLILDNTTEINQQLSDAISRMAIISGSILIAMSISIFFMNRALKRPLELLAEAAKEIREGNLEFSIETPKGIDDQITQLMRNFNLMTRRLQIMTARMEEHNDNLQEEANKLSEVNIHKTRFIRHLGHELRAPLSGISSFAELMLEGIHGDITVKQEKCLVRIMKNSQDMLDLVNDLVDQAKLEAGTLELELTQTKPIDFARDVFESLEGQATQLKLDYQFQAPKDFSPQVNIHPTRMRQVIINLLSNAFKFTPEGGSVSMKVESKQNFVLIHIQDSGVGIDPQEIEMIFTEFHQSDTYQKHQGAGLGLPLSRQLVRLHSGDIMVESTLGKGSCFTVRLPSSS